MQSNRSGRRARWWSARLGAVVAGAAVVVVLGLWLALTGGWGWPLVLPAVAVAVVAAGTAVWQARARAAERMRAALDHYAAQELVRSRRRRAARRARLGAGR